MGTKKPRSSQHFLVNKSLARKIVDLAEINPDDLVVEIGPGRGSLTTPLLDRARRVWAIELDGRLVRHLHEQFSQQLSGPNPPLRIIQADAMAYPFTEVPAPFKVVANLPYAIASPLLIRLLELRRHIPLMVLMFQREVADRLTAQPGSRRYGLLTILAQLYAELECCAIVSPGSFRPRPKVESAIVKVVPRPQPLVALPDDREFVRLVRVAFSHRRKTLLNCLRQAQLTAPQCRELLDMAHIDPRRRPETLAIEEWGDLSRCATTLQLHF